MAKHDIRANEIQLRKLLGISGSTILSADKIAYTEEKDLDNLDLVYWKKVQDLFLEIPDLFVGLFDSFEDLEEISIEDIPEGGYAFVGSIGVFEVYFYDSTNEAWKKSLTDEDLSGFQALSEKGQPDGYASLDGTGRVPASQLPSFVDDVLEFANLASFPVTGETGKIYIALDTNKTYRWGGTVYVEISEGVVLGETSTTAYRGDRGKIAYDYSQIGHLPLTGGTVASSGSVNTLNINHASGSGLALNVIKGGNGEGLRVEKTGGSGNAATIIGGNLEAPTFVKTGGLSSQFLKADGSVDAGVYALDNLVVKLAGDQTITGTKTFNANLVLGSASALRIVQSSGFGVPADGTSAIDAINTAFVFAVGLPTIGGVSQSKEFRLETSGLTNNTNRVYTMPNADGTLALLSDLGAYVTLSGTETITGQKTFNATQIFNSTIIIESLGSGYKRTQIQNIAGVQATAANNLFSFNSNNNLFITKSSSVSGSGFELAWNNTTPRTYTLPDSSGTLALSNSISGTTNFLAKFTAGGTVGDSAVFDNGTNVGIGTTSPARTLHVLGQTGIGTVLKLEGASGTTTYLQLAYNGATNSQSGYIAYDSSSNMSLFTNDTERMRITSVGNVGIGTTSPSAKLDVNGDIYSNTRILADIFGGYSGGDVRLTTNTGGTANLLFQTANTERMRITSGGNVLIGSTSAISTRQELRIGGNEAGSRISMGLNGTNFSSLVTDSGGNLVLANEYNDSAIKLFIINYNNGVYLTQSATSWTANSDERLKDINGTIENAVDKLLTLRAVNFSWKKDENKKEVLGLIAQEVEKVFPQIIDKNKILNQKYDIQDETEYLGVRYTELIPVLIKAIQEQQIQIKELKSLINK
jgi:hypothetical protein